MLELKKITKTYETKDLKVKALKGVDIKFRKSEFVSILGPSGCGKTTFLNIVGGLDKYTSGDLIINGKSTKDFTDRDWDAYRNHTIGFVFQSYNLIPHQTVLENVELALTLSGVSSAERKKRATDALKKVGLGDKLSSKPNQLSGGQMQRVAIARALVNDPDIVLADEPTGALDSKTSVQVMNLLQEIAKEKLVVMVTHNPELAEQYSTRIIKFLDGELVDDSMPYGGEEETPVVEEPAKKGRKKRVFKKTSMSFWTALSLSFKNLLTKKTRTLLVSFAGSIGIFGIALILAISSGFNSYINRIQEDTLSSSPIKIEEKSIDFSAIIMSMFLDDGAGKGSQHDRDAVYDKDSISSIMSSVGDNISANNLNAFNQYINEHYSEIEPYVNAIQYTYDLDLEFYRDDAENTNVQPNSNALMKMIVKYSLYFFENKSNVNITSIADGSYLIETTPDTTYDFMHQYTELLPIETALRAAGEVSLSSEQVVGLAFTLMGFDAGSLMGSGSGSASSTFSQMSIFYEMINNKKLLKEQYDVLAGNFVEESGDALLVLDSNNEVDEYVLYALGLLTDEQMDSLLKELVKGNKLSVKIDYSSILGTKYKVLEESDYFIETAEDGLVDIRKYIDGDNADLLDDKTKYATYYAQALANSENYVTIKGIVRLKDSIKTGSLQTGVAYTSDFTSDMIKYHNESVGVVNEQLSALDEMTPKTISIYANSFEAKSKIQEFIDNYNENAENGDEISYTDYVGMIMGSVSTIINAISYVLIAFVSVSLVVSSIMIGIITYISVLERIKEIGILRAVGASKRDVKRVFTAETLIIGLLAGLIGVLFALLMTIPVNVVINNLAGIGRVAKMPILGGIVLVLISMGLTFIAGLIPAKIASKKDPVIALRSE